MTESDSSFLPRYLDALFFSIDGNFVSHQKRKKLDPNDFPLTKGASYFMHEDDLKKYLKKFGPLKREVSFVRAPGISVTNATTFGSTRRATSSARWGMRDM